MANVATTHCLIIFIFIFDNLGTRGNFIFCLIMGEDILESR